MTLYKHINNTDVAICVLKKYYVMEKDLYKLKVRWFNIAYSPSIYDIEIQETLKIDRATWFNDWNVYE